VLAPRQSKRVVVICLRDTCARTRHIDILVLRPDVGEQGVILLQGVFFRGHACSTCAGTDSSSCPEWEIHEARNGAHNTTTSPAGWGWVPCEVMRERVSQNEQHKTWEAVDYAG
jgi:hypothetical protein